MQVQIFHKQNIQDLQDVFRKARNQVVMLPSSYNPAKARKEEENKPFNKNSRYMMYQKKLVQEEFEKFKSPDIVYFFRDHAKEYNPKFVISNWNKECSIAKRLITERYSPEEVCAMIEFLFNSEQDYLDKATLSLGIICSSWCNTIYRDMQLWLDDKYVPRKKGGVKSKVKREFVKDENEEENVSIGEW